MMHEFPPSLVLIVTPTGRDAALATVVLEEAGIATKVCRDLPALAVAIGPDAGAVLVAEEALCGPDIEIFLRALGAQEPWSDLPILLLTRGRLTQARVNAVIARLEPATFVTLLERPFHSATLVSSVQAALRARRRQWQVRDLLAQRDEAKKQAETANAAKDRFLATLSHELRTPLNPVLMCTSSYLGMPGLSDDLRDDMAMIHRNVQLEARLIDDLLDITRIVNGKIVLRPEIVDLHQLLRETIPICVTNGSTHPVNLELQAGDDERHLRADRARLQQVFWNLINNAVKFSPNASPVTVRTFNPQPGRLAVEVSDRGIGIEPGRIEQLFGAFQQSDQTITRRFGGLGLGLAISKALVEMHGGRIHAHSEGPGHGAAFTVEMEACEPGS
jgi:signal transduction histidine kinase